MIVRSADPAGSRRSRVLAAKNPANPPPTTTTDGRDGAGAVMGKLLGRAGVGGTVPGVSPDHEGPVHLRVDVAVEGVGPGRRRRGEAAVPRGCRRVEGLPLVGGDCVRQAVGVVHADLRTGADRGRRGEREVVDRDHRVAGRRRTGAGGRRRTGRGGGGGGGGRGGRRGAARGGG